MQQVVPALRVRSYKASKVFYEKLGFQEEWKHQFAAGLPVFASISCAGMMIFLTEHKGDCQFGGLVHFYIKNVDEYFAQLQNKGVHVHEPPTNSIPGIRDMLVIDPDGNRLSFLTHTTNSPT
ncbi:MAG: VOC family protein [Acidobacteria bacterium]|nr:VOC family protein [Acidobacteriota bacterium]MCB9397752.1 VOC family protein [Acidobacteriota bacterium]